MQIFLEISYLNINISDRESPDNGQRISTEMALDQIAENDSEGGDDTHSQYTQSTAPMLSTIQYTKYIKSLVKLLVGETVLNEWIKEGNYHKSGPEVIKLFSSSSEHEIYHNHKC